MKTRNILTITSVAIGTAALTVATFWSGPIEAGADDDGPHAQIEQPTLTCSGVQLSAKPAGDQAIKAGDQPQFKLTAVNSTSETKTANFQVALTCTAPISPLSRAIPVPETVWHEDETLTLKAGEKRTVLLKPRTSIAANKAFTVYLVKTSTTSPTPALASVPKFFQPGAQSVAACTFSTATNTPDSFPVAFRNEKPVILSNK